jgi:hypothetical protein
MKLEPEKQEKERRDEKERGERERRDEKERGEKERREKGCAEAEIAHRGEGGGGDEFPIGSSWLHEQRVCEMRCCIVSALEGTSKEYLQIISPSSPIEWSIAASPLYGTSHTAITHRHTHIHYIRLKKHDQKMFR